MGSYPSTRAKQAQTDKHRDIMGVVASYTPVGTTHRISRSVDKTSQRTITSRPSKILGHRVTGSLSLVAYCTLTMLRANPFSFSIVFVVCSVTETRASHLSRRLSDIMRHPSGGSAVDREHTKERPK